MHRRAVPTGFREPLCRYYDYRGGGGYPQITHVAPFGRRYASSGLFGFAHWLLPSVKCLVCTAKSSLLASLLFFMLPFLASPAAAAKQEKAQNTSTAGI